MIKALKGAKPLATKVRFLMAPFDEDAENPPHVYASIAKRLYADKSGKRVVTEQKTKLGWNGNQRPLKEKIIWRDTK